MKMNEGSSAIDRPNEVIRRLIIAAAGSVLGSAAVLAVLMMLVNRGDWWRGLLAATMVAALTAAASLPPIAVGLQRGLMPAVGGYFVAAGLKMLVSISGGWLAVKAGGYPALPTMVLIVVFYLVLLAAETAVVARALWSTSA